ncbi:hypothetical protein IWC96_14530 [Brevundimonas sp. BAL450]|uniref:hypothetical protein n=1 Tax=Brevundimonas sp. BAL450 TaxID=1708162 RepID=UPI0018C9ACAF|nr:hypothetical protein [Brevundimonas sp. BAL450]MBG7616491.1 hypothetical protein [Brevundimonas sp. BAL450]
MTTKPPLGSISRVYSNADGAIVGVIRWAKGFDGPPQIVTDVSLREGQSVTMRDGRVVVR